MNIAAMLAWSTERHGDRVAFVTPKIERTFAEIDGRANALANALIKLGVCKGDRVGVLIGNQIEYPEAEFAIVKAGAVRVPMLISSSVDEVRRFIEFSDAEIVIAAEDGLAALREARTLVGREITTIVVGQTQGSELHFETLIAGAATTVPLIDLGEDDGYALRFTGGTTGMPKGILMDHRCMVNVVNNMLLNWNVPFDEVVCHFHPLSHAAGKIMYTWWMRGARQVILPAFNFDAKELLATIERERVTTLFMIPTALNVVLDSGLLDRYDTSSLRMIIYGGAPISPQRILEGLKAFGPVFVQIYGCSEAPNVLTTLLQEDHVFDPTIEPPARLRSAGRVGCGVEVRIVDPNGIEQPIGEVGEIVSRGPHTMARYWKDEALTAERVRDGWVYTRDMGYFDTEGYLYVVDRKDDVIITGGFNVWPTEIEAVICEHDGVAEAGVFGAPSDKWGEAVIAVVVPKHDVEISAEEIGRFIRPHLSGHKRPKQIIVRSTPIPKSAVHKPLRRKLREEYATLQL
ncbi:MAG: acyl-CoA synthetase (AMP-forming)/AMP-acid ligase II [Gammaproteobacteria bacterium]|jgi:acyl-CoA synthetase (AMP-forming)/AMP-acid ligase II